MRDQQYGVLLFEEAWEQLGEAVDPYRKEGPIGKYLYCNELEVCGQFVTMTFTPDQVDEKIGDEMTILLPIGFIKFIAHATKSDILPIGFRPQSN